LRDPRPGNIAGTAGTRGTAGFVSAPPVAIARSGLQAMDGVQAMDRLALRREDAAAALSVSDESFDRYVRPYVRVVRLGTLRLYPVVELVAFLADQASSPVEDIAA